MGKYSEGKRTKVAVSPGVQWTFFSFRNSYNCGGKTIGGRHESGWSFIDHDGHQRNIPGNWLAFVEAFNLCADNYGFEGRIS